MMEKSSEGGQEETENEKQTETHRIGKCWIKNGGGSHRKVN